MGVVSQGDDYDARVCGIQLSAAWEDTDVWGSGGWMGVGPVEICHSVGEGMNTCVCVREMYQK